MFWSFDQLLDHGLQGGGEVAVHIPVLSAVPPISLIEEGECRAPMTQLCLSLNGLQCWILSRLNASMQKCDVCLQAQW